MNKQLSRWFLLSGFFSIPVFAQDIDVEALKQELLRLRARDNKQVEAINLLHQRISELEKQRSMPEPSQNVSQNVPQGVSQKVSQNISQVKATNNASQIKTNFNDGKVQRFKPSDRFKMDLGLSYGYYDRQELVLNGFLALDAIFIGNISMDDVKSHTLTLNAGFQYAYSSWLQFNAQLPVLYRETVYRSGGLGGAAAEPVQTEQRLDPALGDASFGLAYTLPVSLESSYVLSAQIKAPTGKDPYSINVIEVPNSEGNLTVPEEMPTGNGIWSLTLNTTFMKTSDPALLFGNLSYTYNHPRAFPDVNSKADVVQAGEINLGNSWQYGLGFGIALNPKVSLSVSFSHRHAFKSRIKEGESPWRAIDGSEADAILLTNSITYNIHKKWQFTPSFGIGLSPDAPDFTLSAKLAL